jgi:hypothetical protein
MWIRLGYYYLKAIQQNYLKIDKNRNRRDI